MTTITALPAPPSRAEPSNFSDRADDFLGALPLFATQANAVAAEINAAMLTAINAPGTSATSTTNLAIGTGSKTMTIQTGKALAVGQYVMIVYSADPANFMHGQILAYNSGTGALTVQVSYTGGSGAFASWVVSLSLPTIALPLSGGIVTGPTSFTSSLSAGSLGVVGAFSVGGTATFGLLTASNQSIVGGLSIGGAMSVGGSATVASLTVSGSATFAGITANGNVQINGGTPTLTFNSGGAAIWSTGANQLAIGIAGLGAQRIFVDGSGSTTIHGGRGSSGAGQGSGSLRVIPSSAGAFAVTTYDTLDYTAMQFTRDIGGTTQQMGFIGVSDTTVTYGVGSDHRLKENVVALVGALERVAALKVRRFNFIANPGVTVDGFIAHEAQEVVPEAVTGAKDEVEAIGTASSPNVVIVLGTARSPQVLRTIGEATPPEDVDGLPIIGTVEENVPEGWTWAPTAQVDITPEPLAGITQDQAPDGWQWEAEQEVDVTPDPISGVPESQCPEGWTWQQTGTRPVYQAIDQAKLVPLLVAAVQELLERVDALENA